MKPLIVHSAAKVNLTLDILSRRRDGYHELQSVVHAVGLWDTLTFDFDTNDGFRLECSDTRLEGSDNLIFKALRAWLSAAENHGFLWGPHLHVYLEKHIPMGAGLGGGSGNAAATLLALNHQHRDVLSEAELLRVAATLGADVPFFLKGGGALMEGIGEKLSPLPALDGWLVIVQPLQTLSTPQVYRAWDELNRESQRATPRLLEALNDTDLRGTGLTLKDLTRAGLQQVDVAPPHLPGVAGALGNDLESAAQTLLPELRPLAAMLCAHGALGAQMSGSGSAVFGLFESEAEARHVAREIQSRHVRDDATLTLRFAEAAPFCREAVRF